MNYLFLIVLTIIVMGLMVLFYKFGKKEGLFLYIGLMSSVLSTISYKTASLFEFEMQFGIPLIVAIFICSNVIVQRYGIDETKRIIKCFAFPYILITLLISLSTLIISSQYNLDSNVIYDNLFGYDLANVRIFISTLLSVGFMLWYNTNIYYYIRKSKNIYLFSNIVSILIVQFIESIVFVLISYVGSFAFNIMFGMAAMRYLIKIGIGLLGLIPVTVIMKMKVE